MDNDWQYSFPELEGTATVEMVVEGEIISIEINGDDAPVTASNFVDLVEDGFYDGLMFHRVVDGFVAQGGDPQGRDPDVPPEELGAGGFIDPETGEKRNIPLEIKPAGAEEPIYSETFEEAEITVAPELPHTKGAIAMANGRSGYGIFSILLCFR
jgi:peptidyl-prolyl cis-trans isomerase B (cyclophilin B)